MKFNLFCGHEKASVNIKSRYLSLQFFYDFSRALCTIASISASFFVLIYVEDSSAVGDTKMETTRVFALN